MGDGFVDSSSRTDARSSRSAATAATIVAGDAVVAAASAQAPLEHARSSGAAFVLSPAMLTRAQTQTLREDSLDRSALLVNTFVTGAVEPPASQPLVHIPQLLPHTCVSPESQNDHLSARPQFQAPFLLT